MNILTKEQFKNTTPDSVRGDEFYVGSVHIDCRYSGEISFTNMTNSGLKGKTCTRIKLDISRFLALKKYFIKQFGEDMVTKFLDGINGKYFYPFLLFHDVQLCIDVQDDINKNRLGGGDRLVPWRELAADNKLLQRIVDNTAALFGMEWVNNNYQYKQRKYN